MKATGTLTFTRNPDGSVSHKWEGGQRIAISHALLHLHFKGKPECGKVYNLNGVNVRLVGREPVTTKDPIRMWQSHYIAMREGWLARIVNWYTFTALGLSLKTQKVDEFVLLGRRLRQGEFMDIPKWSLTGILLRWA